MQAQTDAKRPEPSPAQKTFIAQLQQAGYHQIIARVDEVAVLTKDIRHPDGRYVIGVTLYHSFEVGALIVRIDVTCFYRDGNPTGSAKHSVAVRADVEYLESVAKRCFESLIG